MPSHDLPRAAVDHAHQVGPAHCRPRPDLRHVCLPDLIRLGGFHAAPLFLPSCAQTTRAHQQPTFSHPPQHPLAIHGQPFLPPQPPRHSPIAVRHLPSTPHHDLLLLPSVRPAAA